VAAVKSGFVRAGAAGGVSTSQVAGFERTA
jgi:hypothetical protein